MVQEWFEGPHKGSEVLTRPPNAPDLYQIVRNAGPPSLDGWNGDPTPYVTAHLQRPREVHAEQTQTQYWAFWLCLLFISYLYAAKSYFSNVLHDITIF